MTDVSGATGTPAATSGASQAGIDSITSYSSLVTAKTEQVANCTDKDEMLGLSLELMEMQQILTMMIESFTKSEKTKHDGSKKTFNTQS